MTECRACQIALDSDDNYCRRCGAPVRVVDLATIQYRTSAVHVGPTAPSVLAAAARPVATTAAAVAGAALVRFALRRAVRGLVAPARPRATRALEESAGGGVEVTEIIRYRRYRRA